MSNIQSSNRVVVIGNKVIINSVELTLAPCSGNNSTVINGKVYLDGYEFDFKKI